MDNAQGKEWFADAKFGMFIHWGLYAIPGGEWKGQKMDYIGEWIQSKYRIPNAEYAELAKKFNPVKFDAGEWIRTAKDAGMRYIVLTSKHHDGFAMWDSKCDPYNIVRATPFKRDVLRELSDACAKHGVRLGIYYSHCLDWHEPDAGGWTAAGKNMGGMSWSNDWDFPGHSGKNFDRYFERKALPQVRELLTEYGPVSLLWFDCPIGINLENAQKLRSMIRDLQPDCLVNSRIGQGLGDFGSLGDNQAPAAASDDALLESPCTLNDTWGFKHDDNNWKTPRQIAEFFADIVSKGANYLLNIGPRPDGAFPDESVKILREIGKWTHENASAIYGARKSPFPQDFPWGCVTSSKGRLNLFVRDRSAERIRIRGLENKILRAEPPASVTVSGGTAEITPPPAAGEFPRVVTLVLDGNDYPRADQRLSPSADGVLRLIPARGRIKRSEAGSGVPGELGVDGEKLISGRAVIARDGALDHWDDPADSIEWTVTFPEAGVYTAETLTIQRRHSAPWVGDRKVRLVYNGQILESDLRLDRDETMAGDKCYARGASVLGNIKIDSPGEGGAISLRTVRTDSLTAREMSGLAALVLRKN